MSFVQLNLHKVAQKRRWDEVKGKIDLGFGIWKQKENRDRLHKILVGYGKIHDEDWRKKKNWDTYETSLWALLKLNDVLPWTKCCIKCTRNTKQSRSWGKGYEKSRIRSEWYSVIVELYKIVEALYLRGRTKRFVKTKSIKKDVAVWEAHWAGWETY